MSLFKGATRTLVLVTDQKRRDQRGAHASIAEFTVADLNFFTCVRLAYRRVADQFKLPSAIFEILRIGCECT